MCGDPDDFLLVEVVVNLHPTSIFTIVRNQFTSDRTVSSPFGISVMGSHMRNLPKTSSIFIELKDAINRTLLFGYTRFPYT